MTMFVACLVLLVQLCAAFIEDGANHECRVQLEANWESTPFVLQVLESIAVHNESLYGPAVRRLLEPEDDADDVDLQSYSDEQLYERLFELIESPETRALVDIGLANKFVSPRVQAHFGHYNSSVLPQRRHALEKQCGTADLSWAALGDDVYCSAEDLFAVRSVKNAQAELLPFDRVIGPADRPALIVYGSVEDPKFPALLRTAMAFADSGQYSVVWRYVPSHVTGHVTRERLSGYGVDLTLKRTDYIAVDDRNKKKEQSASKVTQANQSDDIRHKYLADIEKIYDLANLELQFTRFILDQKDAAFDYLRDMIADFPKYASFLSSYSNAGFEDILSVSNVTSNISPGLYINGKKLEQGSLDANGISKALESELDLMNSLSLFGFNSDQSRDFINEFSSIQEKAMTDNVVKRYNVDAKKDAVVYLNDLEKDAKYRHLKTSRKAYLNPDIRPGQVPAIRENVHDSIFVINLSDPAQLFQTLQFVSAIIQRDIPQQVGIVPLIKTEQDLLLAEQFLYLAQTQSISSGFQFLQQVTQMFVPLEDGSVYLELDSLAPVPKDQVEHAMQLNSDFIKTFHITRPQIIANGVFYDFVQEWKYLVAKQLYQDVLSIRSGLESEEVEGSLKDYLYRDATSRRNTLIAPDATDIDHTTSYVSVSGNPKDFEKISGVRTAGLCSSVPLTLSLVGNTDSLEFLKVVENSLAIQSQTDCLTLRLVTTVDTDFSRQLKAAFENGPVEDVLEMIDSQTQSESSGEETAIDPTLAAAIRDSLSISTLTPDSVVLVLNGRRLDVQGSSFEKEDLEYFIDYERRTRITPIYQLLEKLDVRSAFQEDTFEQFSAMASKSLLSNHIDEASMFFDSSSPRVCFSCLSDALAVNYGDHSAGAKLEIIAVINPIEEMSQKVISVLEIFENLSKSHLANVKVILNPRPALETLPINRFFRGVYKGSVRFKEDGSLDDDHHALFVSVPEKTLFTFDMDVPSSWVVGIKEGKTDLDNVRLQDTGDVLGVYELQNILVEGYARVVGGDSPGGLQIQLSQSKQFSDTIIMSNLGYLQLKSNPGLWKFGLKPDSSSAENYDVYAASRLFAHDDTGDDKFEVAVLDLSGVTIYPIFGPKREQSVVNGFFSSFKSALSKKEDTLKSEVAEINIFAVASGHLYERLLGIMTASVMAHTDHTVKFWLIENYMSPTFKQNLPKLAAEFGFSYELVTYKWPRWLRSQREKQRTIWGYKILFLDVLFPQDLEKVIFVDADQIVRTDLKELVDMDLEGAPYGYTPMCDSRTEMEGFRFWKQGYWDKVLGQRGLKYHISALYVIDLVKFRETMAGDILRQHYQQLSADPGSLSNLDQDLPNNLQSTIKIFSLPQEWLWCETWCSDEALAKAKTIDLCNNPLTKEPKLDRARRQIPEWTVYDDRINALLSTDAHDDAAPHDGLARDEL